MKPHINISNNDTASHAIYEFFSLRVGLKNEPFTSYHFWHRSKSTIFGHNQLKWIKLKVYLATPLALFNKEISCREIKLF